MIVLDENIPTVQRKLLTKGRVRTKHIGYDLGRKGFKDADDIIPLLHSLRYPVFATRDLDFYKREFCHCAYCLVCLDVNENMIATFVRKFLRQPRFKFRVNRMGKVVRLSPKKIHYWTLKEDKETLIGWNK
jgi:hypothetical protein